jgi:hypothetical protein
VIQDAVRRVRSAAIIIGPSGLGRWQALELRSFISQCVERELPVVPVLLPGTQLPDSLLFMRELNAVRFVTSVAEHEVIASLVWGVTGDRSRYEAALSSV